VLQFEELRYSAPGESSEGDDKASGNVGFFVSFEKSTNKPSSERRDGGALGNDIVSHLPLDRVWDLGDRFISDLIRQRILLLVLL
jgi:hypothetical protein